MNACIGFIGVHCGMYAMKALVGRRFILIFGAISCGLCELACGIAASVNPMAKETGTVLVAFTALFMFFYDACVGAASYPVATELVSSRLRAWTIGTATALGYFLAWLTGFCSPYFINPQDLNWVRKLFPWDIHVNDTGCRDQNIPTFGQVPILSLLSFSISSSRK